MCMVNLLQLFCSKQMALHKFTRGCQSLEGYPCSSRPSDATNQLSAAAVESLFWKTEDNGVSSCKRVTHFYCFHVLNVSALWVSQNLSARDLRWSHTTTKQFFVTCQQLLRWSHPLTPELLTSDEKLFCRRLVTGDKLWIYHWDPLNKLEFMQWKDVDCPTFTSVCNSAIN